MQGNRDRLRRDDVGDALGIELRLRVIDPVGVADRRGEDGDTSGPDEFKGGGQGLALGHLVGADAVLDASDGFDLAFEDGE